MSAAGLGVVDEVPSAAVGDLRIVVLDAGNGWRNDAGPLPARGIVDEAGNGEVVARTEAACLHGVDDDDERPSSGDFERVVVVAEVRALPFIGDVVHAEILRIVAVEIRGREDLVVAVARRVGCDIDGDAGGHARGIDEVVGVE